MTQSSLSRSVTLALVGCVAIGLGVGYWVVAQGWASAMVWAVVVGIMVVAWLLARRWVNQRFLFWEHVEQAAQGLLEGYGEPSRLAVADDEFDRLRKTLTHVSSCLAERIQWLEAERAKVTTVLDSMVEGVIALDAQGRIDVMNPSARRMFGLETMPADKPSLVEIVRHRELSDVVEWYREAGDGRDCVRELELMLPERRVLELTLMELPSERPPRGLMLVLHDITKIRRLEEVRAEFVANVSHELRTPLTAIKGYLETLLDATTPDPETFRRFLKVAYTHADRMGRLVADLMSLSDIETGNMTLACEVVSLHALVQDVVAIFQSDADKKGLRVRSQLDAGIEVYADRDRLAQILINLVDNAMKYTARGGEVTIACVPSDETAMVTLRVQDTGQGIPAQDLPRLTERFYRVDKARSREEGGTGLGLAIVKHLVHLHRGTIRIESELGKGTIVDVALPVMELASAR